MKKILLIVALLVLAGGIFAYLQYNKPHQDLAKARPDFTVSAAELYEAFESDEAAANEKYLGKIVEVTGTVREIQQNEEGTFSIMLDTGNELASVICELDPSYNGARLALQTGDTATLRGTCSGALMDVVLVRSVIVS